MLLVLVTFLFPLERRKNVIFITSIICITVGNVQSQLKPYRIQFQLRILSNTYLYLILPVLNSTTHFYLSHVKQTPLPLGTMPLGAAHINVR